MAYDLILVDRTGAVRDEARARSTTKELQGLRSLAGCEVFDGYSAPGDLDIMNLAELLEDEASASDTFAEFCKRDQVDPTRARQVAHVAAAFLDTQWGVLLTFVKLPQERQEVVNAYGALVAFARERALQINDPQVGRDVDLSAPGSLPAMWE